ncbi:hypothetical protein Salat_2899200 [Sesamum alatum]|uniref:Uncharacterized protein n=1 Tax=Sesamum alatum TaxID=300844 RepID=A0AAE2C848_9LAMI|nr:hypothetical protein Salat_2899200 [Sesamum alatum]
MVDDSDRRRHRPVKLGETTTSPQISATAREASPSLLWATASVAQAPSPVIILRVTVPPPFSVGWHRWGTDAEAGGEGRITRVVVGGGRKRRDGRPREAVRRWRTAGAGGGGRGVARVGLGR